MNRLRIVSAVASLLVAACDAATLGLPRVALEVSSPDRSRTAIVRNRPSIDPPSQSLWIAGPEGAVEVRRLAEDQQWCDGAIWSADGRHVAFLIDGVEADVYDAESATRLAHRDLVMRDGYPASRTIRDLQFTPDGGSLTFRTCDRRTGADCSMPMVWSVDGG